MLMAMPKSQRPLRVAVLSPPFLPVPPVGYAGTERVVATLAQGLHDRGHAVTLFAPGHSHLRFDIIPPPLDTAGFMLARHCGTPVVTTLHRRLDTGGAADMIDAFADVPLVAISDSQRRWNPAANWVATIHHGLDFSATPRSDTPGDYLLVVGRIAPG